MSDAIYIALSIGCAECAPGYPLAEVIGSSSTLEGAREKAVDQFNEYIKEGLRWHLHESAQREMSEEEHRRLVATCSGGTIEIVEVEL